MSWTALLLLLLVTASLLAVLLAMLFSFLRRERHLQQTLGDLALHHGWTIRHHPRKTLAYLLSGNQAGVAWELEIMRGSRYQTPQTAWSTCDAGFSEGPVIVGMHVGSPHNSTLEERQQASQEAWNLLLVEGGPFSWGGAASIGLNRLGISPDKLSPQSAGSDHFLSEFIVLAPTLTAARQIVTPQVEHMLLEWPYIEDEPLSRPVLIVDAKGASLRLFGSDPAHQSVLLEKLVELGLAVSTAIQHDDPAPLPIYGETYAL